jgi:pimeloyl-ACP methyl ester carboxylesterase
MLIVPSRQFVHLRPTSGTSLHMERFESGTPACLLLHGRGDGAFVWDLLAPVIAREFTTLALDLRGHGNSTWDPSGQYEISTFVSDVDYVIEHSLQSRFVLIGHSLGAHIGVHLCEKYADRMLGAVLMDFAPVLNTAGIREARDHLKQSLQLYPSVNTYAEALKKRRPLARPTFLEHVAARALRRDPAGTYRLRFDPALANAPLTTSVRETRLLDTLLRQQGCPTLLLRGAASALLSRATATRVAETLPNGILRTINQAGHSLMLDNPEGVEHAVMTFLYEIAPRRH